MPSPEYRELGMDRAISRRDFVNGVATGLTGLYGECFTSWDGVRSAVSPSRTPIRKRRL